MHIYTMHLTVQTDYALRIMMFAALRAQSDRGGLFSVEDVSRAYDISRNHAMKIVQRLAGAGYLASFRGRGGGLRLARPPGEINLGELVRFLEGECELVACFGSTHTCKISGQCRLQGALGEALHAFFASLAGKTLADIALPRSAILLLGERIMAPA